jgi:hypothetical protein
MHFEGNQHYFLSLVVLSTTMVQASGIETKPFAGNFWTAGYQQGVI